MSRISAGCLSWRSRWESPDRLATEHCPIAPPPHPTYDLKRVIQDALAEDAGLLGDVTVKATIPAEAQASASFLAKADGVLAGLAVADLVFQEVDPGLRVRWSSGDGERVERGRVFGVMEGSARSILVAERVALNFMQRMSGIATATAAMVEACRGERAKVLDIRKTVPGLRLLDKWAVLIGGGSNHRMGLFDMMMIKDNHIATAGSIAAAVERAQAYLLEHNLRLPVEVETQTLDEVRQVVAILDSGAPHPITRVMLDNMTPPHEQQPGGVDVSLLRQAVGLLGDRVETEASGNVTQDSVAAIASSGVHFISCGALTHSVKALDISLNIQIC